MVFKLTADECPDPDGGFVQNEASTFVYREPDIDVSPVTAEFDDRTVLVNWTPAGDGTYQISIINLASGNQTLMTYNGIPPFSYTPPACGRQYSLNISVSPAQCAGEPAFTHHTSVSFTLPCQTPDQSSGTLATLPSWLAIAAMVPLLRIARPAF